MRKDRNQFFAESTMSNASGYNPGMMAPAPGYASYNQGSSGFYMGPPNQPYPNQMNPNQMNSNINTYGNDIDSRITKLERQVTRLESRVSKLEGSNMGNITNEESNLYMI